MTPQPDPVLALFEQTGAYLKGHFRLTSGLHSPEYLQCALVLRYPQHAETLGRNLAARLQSLAEGKTIDMVVSPAMGGMIIGHEVGTRVGRSGDLHRTGERRHDVAARLSRRAGNQRRGGGGRRDDWRQHARSDRIVAASGSGRGGGGSIIDRSGGAVDLGVPRAALATMKVTAWPQEECPLCAEGSPVVKPGSRI